MATASKLDTVVPTTAPTDTQPPVVAHVSAIVAVAKMIGGGPMLQGFLGGLLAVVVHSYVDSDKLVKRVETLERAFVAADQHNAWVQGALVSLSKGEAIEPPAYREIAPP